RRGFPRRGEQRGVPAGTLGELGVDLGERTLRGERVPRLAGEEVQALQRERSDAVPGRRGVLVAGLGAMDQLLMVMAGEEETALVLVLEALEQRLREVLGERERVGVEIGLDQLEQRGEQEGVVVQVGVEV